MSITTTFTCRFFSTMALLFAIAPVYALSGSDVTVSVGSGPYFYADDGNCGSREVPRAAYLVINVTNSSSTDTLYNIQVKLDSLSNGAAGFKLLSFTDDSTYTIPRILPSSSEGGYFYIQYPCTKNLSCTFDFTLSNDNPGTVAYQTTITTEDIGPAGAGGDIIQQSIAGIDALGILVADTVTYEFGNYNGGEMFFQPSGDTLFPTDNMELIGSKVISSAFSTCAAAPGDQNILYYNSASGCGAGSGNQVKVVYFYLSSLLNDTAEFKPYSGMKSGGPIKYLSNYGTGIAKDTFGTTLNANKFTIEKSASCGICAAGDTITYTIKISNSASADLMFDKILDSLPSGHSFVGFNDSSDITALNCSSYPSAGAVGNITFQGMIPEATFPYRSFLVPASSFIELKYRVKIPGTTSNDLYRNQAIGQVGQVKIDTAQATTCVGCVSLPTTMIYFKGQLVGQSVQLNWATASETNNYGFDVYRYYSESEEEWLDFIPGAGNSSIVNQYSAFDHQILGHSQTYKLVQSDYDGTTSQHFTHVKAEQIVNKYDLAVYPNPASSHIRIDLSEDIENAQLQIFDAQGKQVVIRTLVGQESIKVADIIPGIYTVKVILESGELYRQKLIVQR